MWWKGLIVAIIAVTLVASVIIANKKNIYDPGSYPLLRSQILFFDSRLNGSDDSRYRVMLEVVWLLADYGTSKPVFQECKRLLMQMWHDDYSLLAAQSLEAFIVEGIVIDKKRLPVTTFWKHGTYANAIGMRPDCWKDSFIKVDMRDSKSIGDFLATERTTLAQSYKQAGIQIGPAAQKNWSTWTSERYSTAEESHAASRCLCEIGGGKCFA